MGSAACDLQEVLPDGPGGRPEEPWEKPGEAFDCSCGGRQLQSCAPLWAQICSLMRAQL